jgi:hypothetical protein
MNTIRILLFIVMALGGSAQAWGQRPPVTHPASADRQIQLAYDRSSLPSDQYLWSPRTILGYSHLDPSLEYGRLHLVCESDTDTARGRCPVADTHETGGGQTEIALLFTEKRSGLRAELNVTGSLVRGDSTIACHTQYWETGSRPLSTSVNQPCSTGSPVGTAATLLVPGAEFDKLVAGRWSATLKLVLRNLTSDLATYTFRFDLTITDHDRASIYFPASDNVTPLVNLNVGYYPVPSPAHIYGGTALDMCLYDGLGSQVPYLEVKIRDDGREASDRAPGMHSVWHHAGGSGPESRLDYRISLNYAGTPLPMDNNVTRQLLGIDTTLLRLVVLPGMSQPVYCVPAPLTLDVPRVLASSKLAGYYEGRMIIEMIVPSSTP